MESNEFLSFKQNYFYGDLLESTGEFEEPVLILLEMLRIYFPAGRPMETPQTHEKFFTNFSMLKENPDRTKDQDEAITLLSRVFSLFPFNLGNAKNKFVYNRSHLDFDISVFQTYAQTLKNKMRFVF